MLQAYASVTGVTLSSAVVSLREVGFTAAEIALADSIRFSVTSNPINYLYDGTFPVAGDGGGNFLAADSSLVLDGNTNIHNLRLIAHAADAEFSATLLKA